MKSFILKVESERSVLLLVNSYTHGKGQLAGLSESAIISWCLFHGIPKKNNIFISLLLLGHLCGSLFDRSNSGFVRVPKECLNMIEKEKNNLKDAMQKWFLECNS